LAATTAQEEASVPDGTGLTLLYNGNSDLRKGRNKNKETVWILFETDLYFSLS
jgi:hypothetical protein